MANDKINIKTIQLEREKGGERGRERQRKRGERDKSVCLHTPLCCCLQTWPGAVPPLPHEPASRHQHSWHSRPPPPLSPDQPPLLLRTEARPGPISREPWLSCQQKQTLKQDLQWLDIPSPKINNLYMIPATIIITEVYKNYHWNEDTSFNLDNKFMWSNCPWKEQEWW